MLLRKWFSFVIMIGVVIVSTGIYIYLLADAYHEMHKSKPTPEGIWTPANETELVPPEIDTKNMGELLPLEIKPSYISHDGLELDAHEIAMIKYTNEFRVRNGLRPLIATRKLMGTARLQAWHQTRRGMRHGMTKGWRGENIAMGQQSAREVVNTWQNSSGHRANLLGNYQYIGVGGYENQWAQQFE